MGELTMYKIHFTSTVTCHDPMALFKSSPRSASKTSPKHPKLVRGSRAHGEEMEP